MFSHTQFLWEVLLLGDTEERGPSSGLGWNRVKDGEGKEREVWMGAVSVLPTGGIWPVGEGAVGRKGIFWGFRPPSPRHLAGRVCKRPLRPAQGREGLCLLLLDPQGGALPSQTPRMG